MTRVRITSTTIRLLFFGEVERLIDVVLIVQVLFLSGYYLCRGKLYLSLGTIVDIDVGHLDLDHLSEIVLSGQLQ